MPHPLPPYLGAGYLYTAFIADNALIAYPLILAAGALKVLGGAEYAFTKKAIPLRL
jgi:hypothetical protein